MGARHALFRPFAAPRPAEIPESPRGWYGADRLTRQGRRRFCRAAVLRLRPAGRASLFAADRRRKWRAFQVAAGHPDPGNRRHDRHSGDIRADRSPQCSQETNDGRGGERDRCCKGAYPQARTSGSHASRRDLGPSGECVGSRSLEGHVQDLCAVSARPSRRRASLLRSR
jgi:hypothetical protein